MIKHHFRPAKIADKAKEIFQGEFVEKQFYAQLGYFKFINYDEEVIYVIENPPTHHEIKSYLKEVSIESLNA